MIKKLVLMGLIVLALFLIGCSKSEVICPVDSFYDETNNVCIACPIDYYPNDDNINECCHPEFGCEESQIVS